MPNTLVINLATTSRASYYQDWQDAFMSAKQYFNPITLKFVNINNDIQYIKKHIIEYELIILLHACSADTFCYIDKLKPILEQRHGKLLVFIGNEYNIPSNPLSYRINAIKSLAPDYIATQLPIETGKWLYKDINSANIIAMPHALNSKVFTPGDRTNQRSTDFGVRTFKYPPFIGDRTRNTVTDLICNKAKELNLTVDLSYNERLKRADWAAFLQNSKYTVATPAGTDYLSPSDDLVLEIAEYIEQRTKTKVISTNQSFLRCCASKMPFGLKSTLRYLLRQCNIVFSDDTTNIDDSIYNEIEVKFFTNKTKSLYSGKCISSRHLDAIGTKTAQILLEGNYNGILQPYEHYIPLQKDLSNLDEAFSLIKDTTFINKLIDRTYEYIISAHTYENRMQTLSKEISL